MTQKISTTKKSRALIAALSLSALGIASSSSAFEGVARTIFTGDNGAAVTETWSFLGCSFDVDAIVGAAKAPSLSSGSDFD